MTPTATVGRPLTERYDESTSAAPMGGADGVGGLAKDSTILIPVFLPIAVPRARPPIALYTQTKTVSILITNSAARKATAIAQLVPRKHCHGGLFPRTINAVI